MLLQAKVNELMQLPKAKSTVNHIQLLHCSLWAAPFNHVDHTPFSDVTITVLPLTSDGKHLRRQGTEEVGEAKQEATDVSIRHV